MGHGLNSVHQFVSYIVTTDTFGQESQDRQDRRSQRSKALRKAEFLSWKQKKLRYNFFSFKFCFRFEILSLHTFRFIPKTFPLPHFPFNSYASDIYNELTDESHE